MNQPHNLWITTLCVTGLVLVACSKQQTTPPPEHAAQSSVAAAPEDTSLPPGASAERPATDTPAPDSATPAAGSAPSGMLSDAQILRVTETVDRGELQQAELAQQKARSPAIKQFARHMQSEHTKSLQKGAQLAKQANVKPAESPLSIELETEAGKMLETLQTAEPNTFDREYARSQVEQHQAVLGHIDNHLLPSASDPTLKQQLQETRRMVSEHLTQARQLQTNLTD